MRFNAMRLAAMLACLFVFVSMLARADDSSSKPTAISPGTFLFLGETYRIAGIDTPRLGSEAGCPEERELAERAMARLDELFKGVVVVKRTNEIVDGARLATVYVDGRNIASVLREENFAVLLGGKTEWCANAQTRKVLENDNATPLQQWAKVGMGRDDSGLRPEPGSQVLDREGVSRGGGERYVTIEKFAGQIRAMAELLRGSYWASLLAVVLFTIWLFRIVDVGKEDGSRSSESSSPSSLGAEGVLVKNGAESIKKIRKIIVMYNQLRKPNVISFAKKKNIDKVTLEMAAALLFVNILYTFYLLVQGWLTIGRASPVIVWGCEVDVSLYANIAIQIALFGIMLVLYVSILLRVFCRVINNKEAGHEINEGGFGEARVSGVVGRKVSKLVDRFYWINLQLRNTGSGVREFFLLPIISAIVNFGPLIVLWII